MTAEINSTYWYYRRPTERMSVVNLLLLLSPAIKLILLPYPQKKNYRGTLVTYIIALKSQYK
jgi:hypothetical protein